MRLAPRSYASAQARHADAMRGEQIEERVVVDWERARQSRGLGAGSRSASGSRCCGSTPASRTTSKSRSVRPLSDSYCAIVPSRSGNPSRCWPSNDLIVDSSVVNHATSCSGAPIDVMSQSSTASGARSSPKITLPSRTSPHSRTGSDSVAGSVRATPLERVDERGDRRAAARPVEIVGPEVELRLVVAFGNAGRGGEVGAMRRGDGRR